MQNKCAPPVVPVSQTRASVTKKLPKGTAGLVYGAIHVRALEGETIFERPLGSLVIAGGDDDCEAGAVGERRGLYHQFPEEIVCCQ